MLQAQSERAVRTFTIGFEEAGYNEAEHAKAVAAHLGTEHTEYYVTPSQALDTIPDLPGIYDEPFADSSQIPTILVSKLARQHVTVALSGDGGDELFGGYIRYIWGRSLWNRIQRIPPGMRSVAGKAIAAVSPRTWGLFSRALAKLGVHDLNADRIHKVRELLGLRSPDALYLGLVSHWKDPALLVPGSHEPVTALTDYDHWPQLADFTQRMMYLDTVSYLPDDILVKVDRASMSVGLETRVPLLDHNLVEYAWRLPLALKMGDGQGKRILREVLDRYVPRKLVDRPKMGFGVPIDSWLRGPLRPWAEELLAAPRLRAEGYFDPGPIRAKWDEHLSGRHNWQYYLWDILMFQAWLAEQRVPVQGAAYA